MRRKNLKDFSIAIDGPASAGKSTIAKMVANELNYIYLDTGAMYRSLTYMALKENCSLENEADLVALLNRSEISFSTGNEQQLVFVNDEDVTEAIRQTDVTKQVSLVSSHALVREEMVARQQEIAKTDHVVMDGRDIGTVVLPDAPLKIFLVATAEERALRRYNEETSKGMDVSLKELTDDLIARDHYDTTRSVSPLRKAKDAIEIDSTTLSIEEVVEKVLKLVDEKRK